MVRGLIGRPVRSGRRPDWSPLVSRASGEAMKSITESSPDMVRSKLGLTVPTALATSP
ncbi:hypothetical protein [Fodinicola feengrottensis]|uniref:hypothetical protein n=1 Tax=Fodinicola feengrottensis TaxID=435914 RepID=UPI0013CFDFCD|nr:hypothetical protein [Fodinicola feengrottensis]